MAYTPINWQTGDTITATKLNKCDNGWSVESSSTTILSETVTTTDTGDGNEGQFAYTDAQINASQITVTFNGTDYTCDAIQGEEGIIYGDDSGEYTNYPFAIFSMAGHGYLTFLYTPAAGTYTVVITVSTTTTEVSDDFETASQAAVADSLPLKVEFGVTTWQNVYDAFAAGRMAYVAKSEYRSEPVIFASNSYYQIICLGYANNSLTTSTYDTDDGTANGVIVEN